MNLDTTLRVRMDAVIQLINEHTNMPIIKQPKIYTSCHAIVVPKPAGYFAFANTEKTEFCVKIDVPLFLSETVTLNTGYEKEVKIVRMSPTPDRIFEEPKKGQTYLCGIGKPDENVFLHCPVNFCRIAFLRLLEDGRALFESRNFQDAVTGRTLLLKNNSGDRQLITTMIDPEYFPKRYFLSEQSITINTDNGVTAEPVMTVRADSSGKYLAVGNELREGYCTVLEADGSEREQYPFRPGGRFILK